MPDCHAKREIHDIEASKDGYRYFHICDNETGHDGPHHCFLCWMEWETTD